MQEAYRLLVPFFVRKYGGQFQTDFPHGLMTKVSRFINQVIREFVDFIEDYENYDLGNLEGEKRKHHLTLKMANNRPLVMAAVNCRRGRYNFEFVRVAGADDNAESIERPGK